MGLSTDSCSEPTFLSSNWAVSHMPPSGSLPPFPGRFPTASTPAAAPGKPCRGAPRWPVSIAMPHTGSARALTGQKRNCTLDRHLWRTRANPSIPLRKSTASRARVRAVSWIMTRSRSSGSGTRPVYGPAARQMNLHLYALGILQLDGAGGRTRRRNALDERGGELPGACRAARRRSNHRQAPRQPVPGAHWLRSLSFQQRS